MYPDAPWTPNERFAGSLHREFADVEDDDFIWGDVNFLPQGTTPWTDESGESMLVPFSIDRGREEIGAPQHGAASDRPLNADDEEEASGSESERTWTAEEDEW
jgi:hypothetical protein